MKKFYQSRTFWVNLLGIGAILVQNYTNFVLPPEFQLYVLGLLNIFLRFDTSEPIGF